MISRGCPYSTKVLCVKSKKKKKRKCNYTQCVDWIRLCFWSIGSRACSNFKARTEEKKKKGLVWWRWTLFFVWNTRKQSKILYSCLAHLVTTSLSNTLHGHGWTLERPWMEGRRWREEDGREERELGWNHVIQRTKTILMRHARLILIYIEQHSQDWQRNRVHS